MARVEQLGRRSNLNKNRTTRIAQLALAAVAALTFTGQAEARNHPNKIILVRPEDLPELARVPGQAMLLHYTGDGKMHLLLDQDHVAPLSVFDVTDPAHAKAEAPVQLYAPCAFR